VNYYYDTSALCQNYHTEAGSSKVAALFSEPSARHVISISRLTHLEIHSAFALKVRTGEIVRPDFELFRKHFRADVSQRRLLVVRLLRRHFDAAEALIVKHGTTARLRSLDAIHLAVAMDLHQMKIVDDFVCADSILVQLARSEQLTVINPLEP